MLTAAVVATAASAQISLADVWTAYDAFNSAFLDTQKHIYVNTSADTAATDRWNGAAAIWCQPMYVDMALNAMLLARQCADTERETTYRQLANRLIDGNIAHYQGFDFDNNDTNRGWFIYDDIQWWTITLARAAALLGRDDCRTLAEKSFARVWYGSPRVGDTGSYADPAKGLGGGLFWQWQPISNPRPNEASHGKMSCINFPTVVAAMMLYEITPEKRKADPKPQQWDNAHGHFSRPAYETKKRYLEMAKEIYDWSVANLVDTVSGRVADHCHSGRASGHPLLYNQGTYIGASALLYLATGSPRYLRQANAGATYSIYTMSLPDGFMPWAHSERNPYGQGSLEQGIYPAIWGQYMHLLVDRCRQTQYLPYIERNIAAGWAARDTSRNITSGRPATGLQRGEYIGSYEASSIPALMLLFPPLDPSSDQ